MSGGVDQVVEQFRAALGLLGRHPILIVPPLAAQAILAALVGLLVGGGLTMVVMGREMAGMMGMIAGILALVLVGGLLNLLAAGVVIVMAHEALGGRQPTLGGALALVAGRLGDVVVAVVLVGAIVGLGYLLLILPGLVAAFFLVFTLPAVLLDRAGGVEALGRSARTVWANLGPMVGLALGGVVLAIGVALVTQILWLLPLIGWLGVCVVWSVFAPLITVVIVRVWGHLGRG